MVSRTVLPRAASERIVRPHTAARFNVETNGRLIKEDQVRIAGQRDAEEHTLLLAAAELAEHAVFNALKTRGLDDLRVRHRLRIVAAEDGDVLAHAQHLRRAADLQHHAGAQACGGVARVCAKDAHAARGRRAEAHQQLHRGRLARAVRPQQGDDLATLQLSERPSRATTPLE